jgi:hypothetical protein
MAGLNPESAISHGDSSAGSPPSAIQPAQPSGRRKRKRNTRKAPRREKRPKRTTGECTGVQSTEDVPLEIIDTSDVLSALEAEASAGGLLDGVSDEYLDNYLSFLDTVEEQGPTAGLPRDNGGIGQGNINECLGIDYELDDFLNRCLFVDRNVITL